MTERSRKQDKTAPTDSEIMRQFPLELELMQVTDPKILEERILDHAHENFSPEDAQLVSKANDLVKDYYKDDTRKYSDTPAILHAYRVTLAGDNTAAYKTIIKLLHDAAEDYDMPLDKIDEHFGTDARLIREGVVAFTKNNNEEYDEYLKRLKRTALFNPQLSHLVADKMADMITNCLDPVALPSTIRRKPETYAGVTKFLNKIESNSEILVGQNNFRSIKLTNAVGISRKALERSDLALAA